MELTRKQRFDAISKLGCVVCRVYLEVYSEPHIHHLSGIKYRAIGKKADDEATIGLCPGHHLYGNKDNPSVHGQPKLFAEKFGTQEELLEIQNKLIEAIC